MKIKLLFLALFLAFNVTLNAQKKEEKVSRYWTSFSQKVKVSTETKKKIKLTADVKTDSLSQSAWAGLWLRVDTHNKEPGFFDNMGNRPIKINKWTNYTIEGSIDVNSESINFGGIAIYNGKFFFDNFKLLIEDEDGKMQEYPITNADFEKEIANDLIPDWNEGKVKEFSIVTHNEDKNKSLLITGSNIEESKPVSIGDPDSESPQIEAMISMLNDLKARVEYAVKNLKKEHVDHLHDEKANRIGALVMHLAAAEAFYQVSTFENRGFNDEEKKKWNIPLSLGKEARLEFKDKDISHYLKIYNEVRERTIKLLKEKDDAWFTSVNEGSWGTNQYQWFHVMEHQSSHLGQILFLKKRLPPINEIKKKETIKN